MRKISFREDKLSRKCVSRDQLGLPALELVGYEELRK
jgi:hypothetical protein